MSRVLFLPCRRHVELEVDDISVLHHVLLALLPVLSGRPDGLLRPELPQVRKGHHLGADEAALKVGVDGACGLRGLGALADLPALDLILAGSEEVDEVDGPGRRGAEQMGTRALGGGPGSGLWWERGGAEGGLHYSGEEMRTL